MSATVISKPHVQELLFNEGVDVSVAAVELPDDQYALPAADWIANEFAREFAAWRNGIILRYAPAESDCDDFAEAAAVYAKMLYRFTAGRPKDAALAFGEFWYASYRGGHAINVAVCRTGDNLRLVFFEPQEAKLTPLTREEISSCSYLRM